MSQEEHPNLSFLFGLERSINQTSFRFLSLPHIAQNQNGSISIEVSFRETMIISPLPCWPVSKAKLRSLSIPAPDISYPIPNYPLLNIISLSTIACQIPLIIGQFPNLTSYDQPITSKEFLFIHATKCYKHRHNLSGCSSLS